MRHWLMRGWRTFCSALRPLAPGARGVYHPRPDSMLVLGVALPPDADLEALRRRLWWRGLGLVPRAGHWIAGADVTEALAQRRMRAARVFVTRQLRDAGVRGPVRRWEREAARR
ncbi:hypothetical protein [Kallotenue papyrolyticum]|uniref:hypothetical protein n=1 Tax=Kallotenue papyrolyticum TaxID=1325125 RepID=UPI001268D47C|nr:hypothetical protein [Kallotenue papyrolyticum]